MEGQRERRKDGRKEGWRDERREKGRREKAGERLDRRKEGCTDGYISCPKGNIKKEDSSFLESKTEKKDLIVEELFELLYISKDE